MIIALNMLGALCLIWFSIPYLLHDISVTNQDAMIPFQKWEASGFILTFGFVPLAVVNILAMIFIGNKKHKLIVRALFLIPCIVCLGIVGSFWLSEIVQTNVNLQSPCDFYVYDQTDGVFEKLCTWDDTEVMGVALPK